MTYQVISFKGGFPSLEEAANAEKRVNWQIAASEACTVCTECFAAFDLVDVLRHKKQLELQLLELGDGIGQADVRIYVGQKCAREACSVYDLPYVTLEKEEQFRIFGRMVDGKQIVCIYGGSRAGTLYGAAAYMEYHGIRFLFPGDQGTTYHPELDLTAEREFDITQTPSFDIRECCSEHMYDTRFDLLMWLVHNKLNYVFMHTVTNPEMLHKLCLAMSGGGHTIWYDYMDINHEYPYKHKLFGGEGKPEDPYPVSPLYRGDTNGDGILTYGEAHPEWYAETDGERKLFRDYEYLRTINYATGDFICTSNEDAVTELCRLLVESLSNGPLKHISRLNFYALDNGNWCSCEKCRGESYSYRQFMLAYKLDKAIKKATAEGKIGRKILILLSIYHETLPTLEKPLPEDFDYSTIYGSLAVIERCYVHNIDDPGCVETNKMLCDRLLSWAESEHYHGYLGITEYYNVKVFASMPFLLTERMFHDIPFYHSIGIKRMKYMHMTSSNRGVRALNDYAYAKLLWNVASDKDAVKREYFTSKYGEYAPKMAAIYDELESACANCKLIKHYQYLGGQIRSLTKDLANKKITIYDYHHMKFDGRSDDYQAGPSMTESVQRFEAAFQDFCAFTQDKDPAMFQEDHEQLEYGLYILKYLYYVILANLDETADVREQISFYADKLKNITRPLDGYDYKKNMFENALVASKVKYE